MNGVAEEDTFRPEEFSGMKILKAIKEQNKGNQVIMFTASNKAWNMKALLDAGADGYYIKESPEYVFPASYSDSNARELYDSIVSCFCNGYLRNVYSKIKKIKKRYKILNALPIVQMRFWVVLILPMIYWPKAMLIRNIRHILIFNCFLLSKSL